MSEIKPFKIEIADEDINKLRSRIESTRWPEKETVNDSEKQLISWVSSTCN